MLAVVAALAGTTSAAAAAVSPFPLASRTAWTLTDENGSALRIRSTQAGTAYVLRGFPGLASVRVRANGPNVEAWDAGAARWEPFLRLGAPSGTQYTVALAGEPLWRSLHVTVTRGPCYVTGRAVRGCVPLDLLARTPVAAAGIEKLVFAPGSGPVEVVVQTIAGPRTYVLGGPTR
jgi:hypothetical protein